VDEEEARAELARILRESADCVEESAEAQAQGKPADGPMSCHEEFHLMLESAKADARYSAETRTGGSKTHSWKRSRDKEDSVRRGRTRLC
jgi:hypothetical protein